MMVFAIIVSIMSLIGVGFLLYWNFSNRTVESRSRHLLKGVREEFNRMLADCDQATERNIFVFKESLQELKDAIAVAEKRIAMLDDKIQEDNRVVKNYASLRESENVVKSFKKSSASSSNLASSSNEETNSVTDIPKVQPKRSHKQSPKEERDNKIWESYLKGKNFVDIAAEFSISIGEVEMIIEMKKK